MSTTYYLADSRFLDFEEIQKAKQFSSKDAELMLLTSLKYHADKSEQIAVFYKNKQDLDLIPDDAEIIGDNGNAVSTMGELRKIIEDFTFRVTDKEYYEMHRESIMNSINKLPTFHVDKNGKLYDNSRLKDIANDPSSDLTELFR